MNNDLLILLGLSIVIVTIILSFLLIEVFIWGRFKSIVGGFTLDFSSINLYGGFRSYWSTRFLALSSISTLCCYRASKTYFVGEVSMCEKTEYIYCGCINGTRPGNYDSLLSYRVKMNEWMNECVYMQETEAVKLSRKWMAVYVAQGKWEIGNPLDLEYLH